MGLPVLFCLHPFPMKIVYFGHDKISFARVSASSISRFGVFCVFFMNTRTTTIRRPAAVTESAREIPSLPLSRISHRDPPRCFTCGSRTRSAGCLQTISADLEIRAAFPDGRAVKITQFSEEPPNQSTF
jgi:hypothetical protein